MTTPSGGSCLSWSAGLPASYPRTMNDGEAAARIAVIANLPIGWELDFPLTFTRIR